MSMAAGTGASAGKLFLATAKGRGTGPNNTPQPLTDAQKNSPHPPHRDFTYIATLLHGSLATLATATIDRNLPAWTQTVVADNRIRAGRETIRFADGSEAGYDPKHPNAGMARIRHVIYIIKENRTYDQILGDLSANGHPVGNGDPSLAMYGAAVTPNEHKLALQFGVLDNFFDSGEVSGDGHVWSNAAIGTDYLEKGWQGNYRNGERGYDFEGLVSTATPSFSTSLMSTNPHPAISGRISPPTVAPCTTSASTSPPPSATISVRPPPRSPPSLARGRPSPRTATARRSRPASRFPPTGAAASTCGPGPSP